MFSKDDLSRLLAVETAPAISIFLPTHLAGRDIQQDPIRLKNLIAKAKELLIEKHGMRRPDAETLLQPASALLDDGLFWRHQERGLAVFLAQGISRMYRVPITLPEELVIDSRFALRPLLPLLADDGNFMILAITAGRARLFSATRHGLAEEDADLPKGVAEIHAETDYDKNILHAAPPARQTDRTDRGGNVVKTHSFGEDPEELRKAHLISYVGRIAGRVQDHLKLFHGPLVLIAEDEIQGHFRKDTHPRMLVEQGVFANPDALEPDELHRRAYEIVKPIFEQSRRAALEHFQALHGDANTGGRATTRIEEVMNAAREGRVGVLLVAEGDKVWGRYQPDGQHVLAQAGPADGAVDLVEHATTETLLRGGEVHVVNKEELPQGASTAAILRF